MVHPSPPCGSMLSKRFGVGFISKWFTEGAAFLKKYCKFGKDCAHKFGLNYNKKMKNKWSRHDRSCETGSKKIKDYHAWLDKNLEE